MKTQPFIHAKASRARGRRRLWSSALTTSVGALTVTSSCKQAGFVCDTACFFWVYNVHPRKALPPSRAIRLIMLSFSTSTLISALALCSALTGLVHATGPRTRCIGTSSFPRSVDVPACLLGPPDSLQRSIASRRSRPRDPPPYPSLTSLPLVPRQSNVSCAALEAQGNVNTSTIESMNPGVNCTSLPSECVVQHTDERGPFSPTL